MRYVFVLMALGLVLALHELGHLIAARLLGLRVRRFSLGFGPPLLALERGGTRFTLGTLPFGGSVDVQGMNPHEEEPGANHPHALSSRPPWQHALFYLAGPLLDCGVAMLILTTLHIAGTHVPVPLTVGTVIPGSEAARAGLRPGDRVESINQRPIQEWSVLVEWVAESAGRPLHLTVLRSGEPVVVQLTPRPDEEGAGRIGVSQQYVWRQHSVGEAAALAVAHAWGVVDEGLSLVGRLFSGGREALVSTPVAAFTHASDAAASGLNAFLRVFAKLSLALALFHLLPLPALDGGRILLRALPWATGRRVPARMETLAHAAGFLLLAGLLVALGIGELRRMLEHRLVPAHPPTASQADTAVAAEVQGPPSLAPGLRPSPPPPPSTDAGVPSPETLQVSDLPP